ncbi:MAG: CehA/McbA family metallohydrolase [Planctomycetales bacterium]|nr:CehA/McbA family metallohydrolase [Planctomycetales bacterium]
MLRHVVIPSRFVQLFVLVLTPLAWLIGPPVSSAADLPLVADVEPQPLAAATERLIEALQYVGAPLAAADEAALKSAIKETDAAKSTRAIQKILDAYCVAGVTINAESRVSVVEGPVKKELVQQGWRTFLVKVDNQAGITPQLKIESPNLAPLYKRSSSASRPKPEITPSDVPGRFLDGVLFNNPPLKPNLSGLALEYRILQLYSRDVGRREASLGFNVGQGTQDIGFRNAVAILFNCAPAVEVSLGVKDFDGKPTTAAFVIRDNRGRVYPNPARRLAPDFFFHNQIYRTDGESVHLSPGEYTVEVSRGPEYVVQTFNIKVPADGVSHREEFSLRRWTQPATRRWFSGDHHVHAAGCAHYENPTEGVTPADMMRHILGEDLNVGCVLSWGPCWYSQKQYFEGKTSALSRPNYLMRYDVEVSGFPSQHAGHLCLLRLSDDDFEYPTDVKFDFQFGPEKGSFSGLRTTQIAEWPSWTLPILAWGQKQGAVVGYSHSGWGLALPDYDAGGNRVPVMKGTRSADKLPDYEVPPFDGIGANEYIVTTAHNVCDFISAVDTPSIWELNIWYHTLNCGMKSRISGETDFPCIYGDKVGLGRIYVKLDEKQELNYDNWIQGVKDGRSYCGDGLSHVLDFRVTPIGAGGSAAKALGVGEPNDKKQLSQLNLAKPGKVRVEFDVNALLAEKPTPETEAIRSRRLDQKPYWHLERCRLDNSREVPVEIIVNGKPAASKKIVADGKLQSLAFDLDLPHSSWIAVRILPSVHTNPVFVEVAGKPIHASRKSAEWCVKAVDVCWNSKQKGIRKDEQPAAKAAYDKAREIYAAILKESVED